MTTYQLIKNIDKEVCCILRDGKDSIPFAPANTDYANFKKDLAEGAELQDAEGNVIDGIAYLATLES